MPETGRNCGGLEGPQRTGRACGGGGGEEEEEQVDDDDDDESHSQNIYVSLYLMYIGSRSSVGPFE